MTEDDLVQYAVFQHYYRAGLRGGALHVEGTRRTRGGAAPGDPAAEAMLSTCIPHDSDYKRSNQTRDSSFDIVFACSLERPRPRVCPSLACSSSNPVSTRAHQSINFDRFRLIRPPNRSTKALANPNLPTPNPKTQRSRLSCICAHIHVTRRRLGPVAEPV